MVRISETTIIRAPIDRCFDLARSVEVHLAGNVHCGESAVATEGATTGLLDLGDRVTWRAKHFGVWHRLTSEITEMRSPDYFQDRMSKGPFRSMEHDHYFRSLSADLTEMEDVFRFAAPIPLLGRLIEIAVLGDYMRKLLHERNEVIKNIAESDDWPLYLLKTRDRKEAGSAPAGRKSK